MNKIKLLLASFICSALLVTGCNVKKTSSSSVSSVVSESSVVESETSTSSSEEISSSSSEESSSELSSESESSSSEETISYTVEEAINAVAVSLGGYTSSGNPTSVSDYSDEEGPYFVTGVAFAASGVTADQLKSIVPSCMPVGFELVQDWAEGSFSDSTPYEGCYYLCNDVVLGNMVYSDNYSGTDVVVLQVSAYSIA